MQSSIPVRRLWTLLAIAALSGALSVDLQGCTAIGFTVGAVADAQNSTGGPGRLLSVESGRPVTLVLWDGREIEGRFIGWKRDSAVASAPADAFSPRGAIVRLATVRGELAVPVEGIAKVAVPVHSGKIAGLLVGLAVDAMVISTARSSSSGCESPDIAVPSILSSKAAPPRTGAFRGGR